MRLARLALCLTFGLVVAGCGDSPSPSGRLRLATTTSTENSGLLAWLLPPFEEREGVEVQVIAVGTGQALAIGKRGDADLVLVHAPPLRHERVLEGAGVDRRDVMWNDFVVLGPSADPAGVRGTKDGAAALLAIAKSGAKFVSRGDASGTHVRENELWKRAGGRPAWEGYLEAGADMGGTLTRADELRAYTLSDRGTYVALRRRIELDVLVEGDPSLRNPYGAILVNPEKHPHVNAAAARRLLEYLTSPEGRARIEAFRVDGEVLFHPHAGA